MDDDRPELECGDCGWQGDSTNLVAATDDLDDMEFIYCPECGSDNVGDIDYDDYHDAVLGT